MKRVFKLKLVLFFMTIPIKIISKKEFDKGKNQLEQEEVWDSIAIPWGKYVVKKIPIVEEFLKGKKGNVVDGLW